MLQLHEWAAKDFRRLTKGTHGLSFMTEIRSRAKTLSVIYDRAWIPSRFIQCWWHSRRIPTEAHFAQISQRPPTFPGLNLFGVLAVNTRQLSQTDCQPEVNNSQCVRARVCVAGFMSRHGMVHDPKTLLNDVCLRNIDCLSKGTLYQFLQPPQAAIVD